MEIPISWKSEVYSWICQWNTASSNIPTHWNGEIPGSTAPLCSAHAWQCPTSCSGWSLEGEGWVSSCYIIEKPWNTILDITILLFSWTVCPQEWLSRFLSIWTSKVWAARDDQHLLRCVFQRTKPPWLVRSSIAMSSGGYLKQPKPGGEQASSMVAKARDVMNVSSLQAFDRRFLEHRWWGQVNGWENGWKHGW